LVGNFVALNFEKMREYHRECIKDRNGCNDGHKDYIRNGHFWRLGNIIELQHNCLYKIGGFWKDGRRPKSQ